MSFIFIVITILSCNSPKPTIEDITGVWVSQEGATLTFKKDAKIDIEDYPLYLANNTFEGKYDGYGTWSISDSKVSSLFWKIDIVSKGVGKTQLINNGLAIELLVSRSGFGGSSSEITSLFIWKGDPDADNRYEFKKQ